MLGVHPAIPLAGQVDGLSPDLPTYVPRDIDPDLHAAIRAASRKGAFILLVGSASSGKSRCLFEAANATVGEWRLLARPDPADLCALISSGASFRRTVVWLDDIETYLVEGALTERLMRRLLGNAAEPVIVLASIWPDRYEQLVAPATPVMTAIEAERDIARVVDRQPNSSTGPERVLRLARLLHLNRLLSSTEHARAVEVADADPRIQEALAHDADGMVSVLAAAPELRQRWEHPGNPLGGLLLRAAVDAQTLGHPTPLPADMLKRLVETAYMSPQQAGSASPDWLTGALSWVTQPVKGDAAPMRPHASTVGVIDGYDVSDILVQHAVQQRTVDSASVAALIEAANRVACLSIGARLATDGRDSLAEQAFLRAAEDGDYRAFWNLGLLHEDRNPQTASAWYQRAADAGHVEAMTSLGYLADIAGDLGTARRWYRKAAKAGNQRAMFNLALLLDNNSDQRAARRWYQRAAELGDTSSMLNLGVLLGALGDGEGSVRWTREAATAGDAGAMGNLGQALAKQGNLDAARVWLQKGADAGASNAMFGMAALLAEHGDPAGAQHWYEQAFAHGSREAANNLGMLFQGWDNHQDAVAWLTKAGELGDGKALANLGELFLAEGNLEDAMTWLNKGMQAGDVRAEILLADQSLRTGDVDTVRDKFMTAVEHGDHDLLIGLGFAFFATGHADLVREVFLRTAADPEQTVAAILLGGMLAFTGDCTTPSSWAKSASLQSHTTTVMALTFQLCYRGHTDAAVYWFDRCLTERDRDYAIIFGLYLARFDPDHLASAQEAFREATGNDILILTDGFIDS